MNITTIKINGFKKLTQFNLSPDGNSVEITGANGQGKSSLIDAIWVSLTGKEVPGVAINRESIKANIELGLSSGHIVEWSMSPKSGKKLVVKTENGEPVKAPQAFLDNLIGKISFDPFDFVNKSPKDQREFLQQLLALDFSEINRRKEIALELKREADADVKAIERQIEDLVDATECQPIDVEIEVENQAKHEAAKAALAKLETAATMQRERLDRRNQRATELQEQIAHLQAQIDALPEVDAIADDIKRADLAVMAGEVEVENNPDVSEVLKEAGEVNKAAARWATRLGLKDRYTEAVTASEARKAESIACDDEKKVMLASAKFPVEGLGFTDEGVMFNGLPFDQGNQCMSDILRVGVGIAVAQNPALKIVRIKDGSLLDDAKRESLLATLHACGFQAFIERVTEGPLKAVVITEEAGAEE